MSVDARPVTPTWTFGDRLRKTRSLAGMDQRAFATTLGVTASALAQWEPGRAVPRDIVTIAKRVERQTGVPAAWILGINEPSVDQPGSSVGLSTRRTLPPRYLHVVA